MALIIIKNLGIMMKSTKLSNYEDISELYKKNGKIKYGYEVIHDITKKILGEYEDYKDVTVAALSEAVMKNRYNGDSLPSMFTSTGDRYCRALVQNSIIDWIEENIISDKKKLETIRGATIIDPLVGTGGLLATAYEMIRQYETELIERIGLDEPNIISPSNFKGFDKNVTLIKIANAMMKFAHAKITGTSFNKNICEVSNIFQKSDELFNDATFIITDPPKMGYKTIISTKQASEGMDNIPVNVNMSVNMLKEITQSKHDNVLSIGIYVPCKTFSGASSKHARISTGKYTRLMMRKIIKGIGYTYFNDKYEMSDIAMLVLDSNMYDNEALFKTGLDGEWEKVVDIIDDLADGFGASRLRSHDKSVIITGPRNSVKRHIMLDYDVLEKFNVPFDNNYMNIIMNNKRMYAENFYHEPIKSVAINGSYENIHKNLIPVLNKLYENDYKKKYFRTRHNDGSYIMDTLFIGDRVIVSHIPDNIITPQDTLTIPKNKKYLMAIYSSKLFAAWTRHLAIKESKTKVRWASSTVLTNFPIVRGNEQEVETLEILFVKLVDKIKSIMMNDKRVTLRYIFKNLDEFPSLLSIYDKIDSIVIPIYNRRISSVYKYGLLMSNDRSITKSISTIVTIETQKELL